MPDITLCTNADCLMAESCYRAKAVPSPLWQSYSKFEPRLESNGKIEELICDHFIPIVDGMRVVETDRFADSVPGDE